MMAYDAHDLFEADRLATEAGSLFIRAVTAGEHGRGSEQRALVAMAAEKLAAALHLINPAVQHREAA